MTALERARRWLDAVPGAISGSDGHGHTYYVANTLMHGFGLGANQVLGLLIEWNRTCSPPWSARELNHKVEQALAHADKYERPKGHMLEDHSDPLPRARFPSPLTRTIIKADSPSTPKSGVPQPIQDGCRQLLLAAFEDGEWISISDAHLNEDGRTVPNGSGCVMERSHWLGKLDAVEGDPNRIWNSSDNPGAYIRINPVKVGGSTDNDVTVYRHALLEFDGIPIEQQWKVIVESNIPATAVVHSGGKSLHAWVKVDARDRVEYAARVSELLKVLESYGPDPKNKNPSRFARLPGMRRGQGFQHLLALRIGAKNWTEWMARNSDIGTSEYRIKDLFDFDPANDPNELIGRRWLCKGHSCLLVGASGIGKSTLTMMLVVLWAVGRAPFGIKPKRPLKMLVVQAENDIGDLAEQFRGAVQAHLPNDPDMARMLQENVVFVRDTVHTGRQFVDRLQTLIDRHKPDMVWVDPLLSYIGDDLSDQRVASEFLRNWLGPLLEATGVVLMVVHHIRKPSANDKRTSTDLQYLASGSSELVNWARAVMYLESPDEGQYRLRLLKRGSRAEAVDHEGKTSDSIWIKRGDNHQTWTTCPAPEEPKQQRDDVPQMTVRFGGSGKRKDDEMRDWDRDEYLNSISGWSSYVAMVSDISSKYRLTKEEAKSRWTECKPFLSVKEPAQSGLQHKIYTYIP